ncbi:MAG: 4'-phosphopantetheinyl transferase superfamily protein [Chitinophagales bacterium]|nr:4'-phosphopantetheinyl transferase superfamily protein [Chitinophagales bacterium]
MPLHNIIPHNSFTIGIWQIAEDITFFSPHFSNPAIHHEKKRLQWYATRHLANLIMKKEVEIMNDENGKPYLTESNVQISISHTTQYAAVMISATHRVGIDLEEIHPKVQRVAHKFLREDEINAIQAHELTEKLIVYWSAKEALYKLHGRKQLTFKEQLLIDAFVLQNAGMLKAEVVAEDAHWQGLEVHYSTLGNHILTHVIV